RDSRSRKRSPDDDDIVIHPGQKHARTRLERQFLPYSVGWRAMILTNGRVILSDVIRDDLDVEIRDGKIVELRPRGAGLNAIDLGEDFLAPGFVDLHVHGALGRDAMDVSLESFRAICGYHGRGGTTSLLLTTVTTEIKQVVSVLTRVREGHSKIAQIAGAHVEVPFISPQQAGAQNPEFICE